MPRATVTRLCEVLRAEASALRLLIWTGWGIDGRFDDWTEGARLQDNFEDHWCYAAPRGETGLLAPDEDRAPFRSPTFWWPEGHRSLVFTHIDLRRSYVFVDDLVVAQALVDGVPGASRGALDEVL